MNPSPSKVISDVIIDTDAGSAPSEEDTSEFRGPELSTTSKDVHQGFGHPGSGMSSKEVRHDGKPHREKEGASQLGHPKSKDVELDRAQRPTGNNIGPTSGV